MRLLVCSQNRHFLEGLADGLKDKPHFPLKNYYQWESVAAPRDSSQVEQDCQVCFSKHLSEDNCLVYCSGCECSFHQNCYQVQDIPTSNFYCDVCVYKEKNGGK